MKTCRKCLEEKELDEFYKHSKMKDGHLNACKACRVQYQKDRPKEKVAEIERRRNQKPDRKERLYSQLCKWRKENPEKAKAQTNRYPERRRARTAVSNAIRDGKLSRQPCEKCGKVAEAHHEDYLAPLDVNWLCKEHHVERHVEIDKLECDC